MSVESTQIDLIRQQLQSLEGLKLVYLFGSRAEGLESTNSDWDIALLSDTKLVPFDRWELAQALAAQLGADVDLVDLAQASTVVRMQVILKGQLLLGEQYTADIFETQVYSMYGRLQESRQDILNDFIKDLKDE